MKKLFVSLILLNLITTIYVDAQPQAFGKLDTADLKLTSCSFEPGANAMILFDKASVTYKLTTIEMERHKRIKIFNDNGKDEANIRIEYYGANRDETITDVVAETINLNNKSIEYTQVDKSLIYTEIVNKEKSAFVFTFPNVRAGSVIEFKYKFTTTHPFNFPDWYFQSGIPTRYSEFDASFRNEYRLNILKKIYQPLLKDTAMRIGPRDDSPGARFIWAMADIKAYREEPFMDYPEDYLQRIMFRTVNVLSTWDEVGNAMLNDEDFGQQLTKHLNGEEKIINKAKSFEATDEQIAYLFDTVKNAIKWNETDSWYTDDGIKGAWNKKKGNSTEINLILYHLLRASNIYASLVEIKTRAAGKINPDYPDVSQLNRTMVYCPIDTANYFILDASDPSNSYNSIPVGLNNLIAVLMDVDKKEFSLIKLKTGVAKEAIVIDGNINAQGKLQGSFKVSSTGYNREKYVNQYKEIGEKKYLRQLEENNKGLTITSLKVENLGNDTLALNQIFEFSFNLTEPDGDYIYFNPNQLTTFRDNPFVGETRVSDIDLGVLNSYFIRGSYKIPSAYKASALPKSVTLSMPDKSIVFKRVTGEQEGNVAIQYSIDFKRAVFSKEEYPLIHEFYKKMYEMLNEEIVLKKI